MTLFDTDVNSALNNAFDVSSQMGSRREILESWTALLEEKGLTDGSIVREHFGEDYPDDPGKG